MKRQPLKDLPLHRVSISSTFYEQLLHQYSCAEKLQSQTASTKSFWHKNIGAKAAHKMLMKLTPSAADRLNYGNLNDGNFEK